jgi:hypothetical protein
MLYVNNIGWKSTTIKAEDLLYKGLLLIRAELKVNRQCRVS